MTPILSRLRAGAVLFVLTVMGHEGAWAQKAALVDSVAGMNAAHRWQQAYVLARDSVRVTSGSDACRLHTELLWALTRMGRYDQAMARMPVLDSACAVRGVAADTARIASIRRDITLPPTPPTGIDLSGLREFWHIADILSSDAEPDEAAWHGLFATPGYRLSFANIQPMREDLEISFRPSRRAERDSIARGSNDDAERIMHFARAKRDRVHLERTADSIINRSVIERAVALAGRYLPPGTIGLSDPPLVALVIYREDANGLSRGVVVDALLAGDVDLTRLLAHEFHHAYIRRVSEIESPPADAADYGLVHALVSFRDEGIADQIDKTYPYHWPVMTMADRYNLEYERAPATLMRVDSLLSATLLDTASLRRSGNALTAMLWAGGHPVGAYAARSVLQAFGMDSLLAADRDPLALLRMYTETPAGRAHHVTFSGRSMALLETLEERHRKLTGRAERPTT